MQDALKQSIQQYINAYSSFGSKMPISLRILSEFGTFQAHSQAPIRRYGVPKQCYMNAAQSQNQSHIYTEGIGVSSKLLFPINHAWLTNAKGEAMDITWRKEDEETEFLYFGVKFKPDFVHDMMIRTECYSVLESLYMLKMSADECYEFIKSGLILEPVKSKIREYDSPSP